MGKRPERERRSGGAMSNKKASQNQSGHGNQKATAQLQILALQLMRKAISRRVHVSVPQFLHLQASLIIVPTY
jgi:hypothetical protein